MHIFTYLCYGDVSWSKIENKHPHLEILVHDIGFHLNHSVKSMDEAEESFLTNTTSAAFRFDRPGNEQEKVYL